MNNVKVGTHGEIVIKKKIKRKIWYKTRSRRC